MSRASKVRVPRTERPRLKRDPLPRSAPIRNPVIPGTRAGRTGRPPDAEPPPNPTAPPEPFGGFETAAGGLNGAVERGVRNAYAVIEEYMLRGREAARQYQQAFNQGEQMNNDPRHCNDWGGGGGPWGAMGQMGAMGPMGPMGAWMAPWMQMTRVWMDCMRAFVPMPTDAGGYGDQWGAGCSSSTTARRRPRLSVLVSSRRLTEVVVDITPGAESTNLEVGRLRHQDESAWLEISEIRCEEGQLRVRVSVPDDKPAGRYLGEVYDDRCCKRGEIMVKVFPDGDTSDAGAA
jgi:hypothetical protein